MMTCSSCKEPCYINKGVDDTDDVWYLSHCCNEEIIDVCEDNYDDDIREFELTNYELEMKWRKQNDQRSINP